MLINLKKLAVLVALWTFLPVFLLLTNPETLPLPLLIVPFLALGITLYKSTSALLHVTAKNIDEKKVRFMSGVMAFFPTLLLVLASIDQLTVRDVAIVLVLVVIAMFYMKRIDFLKI